MATLPWEGLVTVEESATTWKLVYNEALRRLDLHNHNETLVGPNSLTLDPINHAMVRCDTTNGNCALTLPYAEQQTGKPFLIYHYGPGKTTVTPQTGQYINGKSSIELTVSGECVLVKSAYNACGAWLTVSAYEVLVLHLAAPPGVAEGSLASLVESATTHIDGSAGFPNRKATFQASLETNVANAENLLWINKWDTAGFKTVYIKATILAMSRTMHTSGHCASIEARRCLRYDTDGGGMIGYAALTDIYAQNPAYSSLVQIKELAGFGMPFYLGITVTHPNHNDPVLWCANIEMFEARIA